MRSFGCGACGGEDGKKETPYEVASWQIQFTSNPLLKETCINHFC